MSRARLLLFVSFSIVLSIIVTGCGGGAGAQLALKFEANDTTTYKYVSESLNDYKFVQPSLNKVDSKLTGSNSEVIYSQKIESVDNEGGAIANVTIRYLQYQVKGKEGVTFDFDSKRESDKSEPFAKLIGQSYKIKIAANGSVEALDTKAILGVIKSGTDAKRSAAFFSDKAIAKRHSVQSLPETSEEVAAGQSWSTTVTPPYRLMVPKTFEKAYTVAKIQEDGRAIIKMSGTPTSKTASDAEKSSLGIFAKMFDSEEAYTGNMEIDTVTGKVLSYGENLIATYTVTDSAEEQKSDKGPDAVTVVLTYSNSLIKVK